MNQEKIGQFIKQIRTSTGLSQQKFASILGVTSQAVSKWENGKNIPDIAIMKLISEKFNVSLNDIINGEKKTSKFNKKYLIILTIIILVLVSIFIFIWKNNSDFEATTITSQCGEFNVYGTISYNNSKTSIIIHNINKCFDDESEYDKIECNLYEHNENTDTLISTYKYDDTITLNEFLEKVSYHIDNYDRVCKDVRKDSFNIVIKATKNGKTLNYDIPLKLDTPCLK